MGTDLVLQPTEGVLVTESKRANPQRGVKVTSKTRDAEFSEAFVDVSYTYGSGHGSLALLFDDIDLMIDVLLEHQAAREGRLEQATTIAEAEARRDKFRARFMERQAKRKKGQQ